MPIISQKRMFFSIKRKVILHFYFIIYKKQESLFYTAIKSLIQNNIFVFLFYIRKSIHAIFKRGKKMFILLNICTALKREILARWNFGAIDNNTFHHHFRFMKLRWFIWNVTMSPYGFHYNVLFCSRKKMVLIQNVVWNTNKEYKDFFK